MIKFDRRQNTPIPLRQSIFGGNQRYTLHAIVMAQTATPDNKLGNMPDKNDNNTPLTGSNVINSRLFLRNKNGRYDSFLFSTNEGQAMLSKEATYSDEYVTFLDKNEFKFLTLGVIYMMDS